jgi:hypothetical protein
MYILPVVLGRISLLDFGLVYNLRLGITVAFHPGLPGVLRHSVKLPTLPQDASLTNRVKKSYWTSLA